MTVNVDVVRGPNENTQSVLRKFTRKTQGTGIVKVVRDGRYYGVPLSKQVKRKKAIARMVYGAKIVKLIKEGKMPEKSAKFARKAPAPTSTTTPTTPSEN